MGVQIMGIDFGQIVARIEAIERHLKLIDERIEQLTSYGETDTQEQ